MRKITYVQAINEALFQLMGSKDKNVILIGQGVTSPWYVGETTRGLVDKFGKKRVIDTPVSENGIAGVAIGAAIAGARPILVHPRMDFMFYAMDQIVNHAAKWCYMFGGQISVPLVVWGIINRGGEQAAQHSQSLQSIFMHIPGLKVVMPSNAYDAKGLLVAAVNDPNPVIYIDDRWLYAQTSDVPKKIYTVPIGKAAIRKTGSDITVIAASYMVGEAMQAALEIKKEGIGAEVIDLRSLKPLDKETISRSVKKTGRVVIADASWHDCGAASEISAFINEHCFGRLKSPVKRITLPEAPAPASCALEKIYYPKAKDIILAIKRIFKNEK